MNEKEIGELRRRVRRDRSNMTAIYGCYVNDKKEVVAEYRQSTATMTENQGDRLFGLMKRTLSGTLGKNLVELSFRTAQVAGSPEHGLLMDLRRTALADDGLRRSFYQKIIDSVSLDTGYLILVGCDSYDVPFKGDGESRDTGETYTYLLCALCPVKQTKGSLRYVPEEKEVCDGGIAQVAGAPALGFLFPAFDGRATNIYSTLLYTHDPAQGHEEFVEALFDLKAPQPAARQKQEFAGLLSTALGEGCSLEAVQAVHDEIVQRIELHRESRVADPLLITREEVSQALAAGGVSQEAQAKFRVEFEEVFGLDAQLHPKNLIDSKKFELRTPDVTIKVAPERSDLIETRVIGGVKYILISAEENVEVNGVPIHIAR